MAPELVRSKAGHSEIACILSTEWKYGEGNDEKRIKHNCEVLKKYTVSIIDAAKKADSH